ncbi:DegV family protein [Chengkuizengella axinellae]|uniref:DegV family protein n=1 Tax=Chengkuizengella axinellae TaxID=3064388 RepID=A0ABT9J2Y0_9BACL|nr:DegV family protein [Chengkuizengella sp. 2205SS18-9]MDP5275979.1 DegV family protein [Chengkuizengella sp. 2205SS18-9]
MTVKIVTDSTSYIPDFLLHQFEISVVSQNVVDEGQCERELDIDEEKFYEKLAIRKDLPSSSQPSVDEFHEVFENHIKNGDDIVGVFVSSEMSGTYETALMVKNILLEKYPEANIELIDSRVNIMQLGFATIAAARAAKAGKDIPGVVDAIQKNLNRSRILFVPETLEYLKRGGRIGTAKALIGSVLQIKPILTVKDGKTGVFSNARTKKRALEKMMNEFYENIKEHGLGDVIIHHIHCEKQARSIADKIGEKIDRAVGLAPIGPVAGLHVGPGTIGIAYYTKEELK